MADGEAFCSKLDIDNEYSKLINKYFEGERTNEEERQTNREKFGTIVGIFGLKGQLVDADKLCTTRHIEKALEELGKIAKSNYFDENTIKRIKEIVMSMILSTEMDMVEKRVKAKMDNFNMSEGNVFIEK